MGLSGCAGCVCSLPSRDITQLLSGLTALVLSVCPLVPAIGAYQNPYDRVGQGSYHPCLLLLLRLAPLIPCTAYAPLQGLEQTEGAPAALRCNQTTLALSPTRLVATLGAPAKVRRPLSPCA